MTLFLACKTMAIIFTFLAAAQIFRGKDRDVHLDALLWNVTAAFLWFCLLSKGL